MQQKEIEPIAGLSDTSIDPFWKRVLSNIQNPQFMLFYVLLVRDVKKRMGEEFYNSIAEKIEGQSQWVKHNREHSPRTSVINILRST